MTPNGLLRTGKWRPIKATAFLRMWPGVNRTNMFAWLSAAV